MSPVCSQPSSESTAAVASGSSRYPANTLSPFTHTSPTSPTRASPLLADEPHLDAAAGPVRPRPNRDRRAGRGGDDRRCLGQPVPLADLDAEPFQHRLGHRHRQAGGAGQREADASRRRRRAALEAGRTRPTCAGAPGMTVMPRSCDRLQRRSPGRTAARARRSRRPSARDRAPRSGRRCGTRATRRRSRRRRSCARSRSGSVRCWTQVAVGEHRRLGEPGGSAREDEHGEMVGLHVDTLRRAPTRATGRTGSDRPPAASGSPAACLDRS